MADPTVTISQAKEYIIGPFASGIYNDATNLVQFTYDSEVNLTVAAVRVTPAT